MFLMYLSWVVHIVETVVAKEHGSQIGSGKDAVLINRRFIRFGRNKTYSYGSVKQVSVSSPTRTKREQFGCLPKDPHITLAKH